MAKATKTTRNVITTVIIPEETIVLELTKNEAQVLADVAGFVAGPTEVGRRKTLSSIFTALATAGYRWTYPTRDMGGVLTFQERG